MGAWFLGNTMAQNVVATGAFEIYVNENLEFSKLNSGQMPTQNDLQMII